MNTIKSIALSDWGPHIERAARLTAAVLAFAATLLVLAAELAYDLGRLTRQALEARNDELATAWRTLLVGVTPEPVVVPALAIAPAPAPRRTRKTTRKARA
jgi:hypothetical protein